MTVTQHILIILIAVLSTVLTRFLPFALFPAGKPLPAFVRYLGRVLPGAVFGLLGPLLSGSHGLPELIAGAAVVALHLWKKNMMLTVAGGTLVYMLLVNLVF